MSDLAHVLKDEFLSKWPESEEVELDPTLEGNMLPIKHRSQNAKVVSALISAQESEDWITRLQESNELTVTFPSAVACNMWDELKIMFRPDDGLSKILMEEDLHKPEFAKKEDYRNLLSETAKITM